MLAKIIELFRFERIDKEAFSKYRYEIYHSNLKNIQIISLVGMLMSLGLVALCLPPLEVLDLIEGYASIAVLFIFIFLFSFTYLEKHENLIIPVFYILIIVSLSISIALGTYYEPDMPATSFVMMVIVLPLFIVDKPYRLNIIVGFMCAVFLVCVHIFKSGMQASLDIGNCIFFYLISVAASRKAIISKVSDIIMKKELETKADKDILTKLYNRGALEIKANDFLRNGKNPASVIVMDMDNFKFINDTYGHNIGDEALIKVGNLLSELFCKNEVICRYGGDEFIVFMPGVSDIDILKEKAEEIIKGVDKLRISSDDNYRYKMCIGIATYPADGTDYESVFRAADSAMFTMKKLGKDGYRFYSITEHRKKRTIIIADDIEMNRVILHRALMDDYNVLVASNGKEVWDILNKTESVEMIITDVQMPYMDGYELVRRIKADSRFKHLAVIVYTSYDTEGQEDQLYHMGIDEFVYKGASPQALKLRVQNVFKAKNIVER